MKKLLLAFLAITALISCKKEPVNYTLFSGIIKNKNSEFISIRNNDGKEVRKIKVSETGSFSDTIFNTNGNYNFFDGKESSQLFLKDGYNLNLNMDAKEFDETITYTGKGSKENNFLAEKFMLEENSGVKDFKKLFALGEEDFLKKVTDYRNSIENKMTGLDSYFVKTEKIENKYDYISKLSNYERYHGILTKNKDFKVSDKFPDAKKGLDYNNEEDFKISRIYKGLVIGKLFDGVRKRAKEKNIPFQTAAIEIIKAHKSQLVKNEALKNLQYEVSSNNPKAEELYNEIMAISTDEDYKKKLTKQFKLIGKLGRGKLSPKFVNYENNAGGTTSLDDLKGKYVYVDVWATWCGPCKQQIPFLKKIEKQYHNKNIEIVSISIDVKKDYNKWKEMIKKEKLGGIQLLADKDWKSQFVQDYGIRGIPRFILIDPNGNIVSSDAPRPSDPKLITLFNELKI